MRLLTALLMLLSVPVIGEPSPKPDSVMPAAFEFSIPTPRGHVKGEYRDLKFGTLLYDSGPNPIEESGPGEVRRWLFQAAGGTLTVGSAKYAATCIRASRVNVLSTTQVFYYELRVSALEGSCAARPENRPVELVFTMDDFVIHQFKSGSLRFFGPVTDVLLYPALLRQPERMAAVETDGGYFLAGTLPEVPFVSDLRVEVLLRARGQTSCHRNQFNPERDPYSSVAVIPTGEGRWGVTVPKLGGAICLRLVGGGWSSAVSRVDVPGL